MVIVSKSHDLSETETRVAYINDFLSECGWNIEKMVKTGYLRMEKREDMGGIMDYLLYEDSKHQRATLVIEAKKYSEDFAVDDLGNPNMDDKPTNRFIDQANDYATHEGIPWFIVTNGRQWFVFKTFQQMIPLKDRCVLSVADVDSTLARGRLTNLLRIDSQDFIQIDAQMMLHWRTKFKVEEKIEEITSLLVKHYSILVKEIQIKSGKGVSKADLKKMRHRIAMRLLQRVVFIKTLEFWSIEPNALSEATLESMKRLGVDNPARFVLERNFEKINEKFNGPLFEQMDSTLDDFYCDDVHIENMIGDFSGLDYGHLTEDIFGDIYEHFLGEIVKETAGNEKERKLKGQYYTPSYVVDYIVRQTVLQKVVAYRGDLRELRIIDPACGSGSFLIKVYQILKDEYERRKRIAESKTAWAKAPNTDREASDGTIQTKWVQYESDINFDKEIARNYDPVNDPLRYNIYGFDIMPDARDLAVMNLMIQKLTSDISLVGKANEPDFFPDERQRMFPLEKILCKDSLLESWKTSQTDASESEKFDIVLGNPPYVQYLNLEKKYRQTLKDSGRFKFMYQRWDLYLLFLEKGFSWLKKRGHLSFIVSGSLLDEQYAQPFREHMLDHQIESIVDLRGYKVFQDATVDTVIVKFRKKKASSDYRVSICLPKQNPTEKKILLLDTFSVPQRCFAKLPDNSWRLVKEEEWDIYDTIRDSSRELSYLCYVTNGLQISPLKSFEKAQPVKIEGVKARPYLKGEMIRQYHISDKDHTFFLYSDDRSYYLKLKQDHGWDFSEDPKSWKPKFSELFENPKIVIPRIAGKEVRACLDKNGWYCHQTVLVVIPKHEVMGVEPRKFGKSYPSMTQEELDLSNDIILGYLVGVINSTPVHYFFSKFLGNGIDVLKTNVEMFPIPIAPKSVQEEVARHVSSLEILTSQLYGILWRFRKEVELYQHETAVSIRNILRKAEYTHALGIDRDRWSIDDIVPRKYHSVRLIDRNRILLETSQGKRLVLVGEKENRVTYLFLTIFDYLNKKDWIHGDPVDDDFLVLPSRKPAGSMEQIISNLNVWFRSECESGSFKASPVKNFNLVEIQKCIERNKEGIDDLILKELNLGEYHDLIV